MLRSPHLVPYGKVDEAIKKANRFVLYISVPFLKVVIYYHAYKHMWGLLFRDTASETVRTLLVYGYVLDPPTGEAHEGNPTFNYG